MAASVGLSCRGRERGERRVFPTGCMWHLSSAGNPTLVKSAQGEKISGDQKSEECRNMGERRMKKEVECLRIRTSEFTCFCLSWCPTQTKVMRHT